MSTKVKRIGVAKVTKTYCPNPFTSGSNKEYIAVNEAGYVFIISKRGPHGAFWKIQNASYPDGPIGFVPSVNLEELQPMQTNMLILHDYIAEETNEMTVFAGLKVDLFNSYHFERVTWHLVRDSLDQEGKNAIYGWIPGYCVWEFLSHELENPGGQEASEKQFESSDSDKEYDESGEDEEGEDDSYYGDYYRQTMSEFNDYMSDPFGGLTFSSHGQRNINAPMSARMFAIRAMNEANHNACGGWRYDEATGEEVYDEGYI